MSKIKPLKTAHTSNAKIGMGDYYGSGLRNKTARSISIMGQSSGVPRKTTKPPKSFA